MEAAVSAGLTRHIGVSNFSAKKLRDLLPHCKIKPEVNQVELHPLLQQPELVEYCASQGIHMTAWAPLGSSDRPDIVNPRNEPGGVSGRAAPGWFVMPGSMRPWRHSRFSMTRNQGRRGVGCR
jgi:hypothetical protein